MPEEAEKNINSKYILAVLAAAVLAVTIVFFFARSRKPETSPVPIEPKAGKSSEGKFGELKKFTSEKDFQDYIEKAANTFGFAGGRGGTGGVETLLESKAIAPGNALQAAPERFSGTNIQTAGIDEPDVVKTDGKEIFFSIPRPEVMPSAAAGAPADKLDDTVGRSDEARELAPLTQTGGTKIVNAFPPENLEVLKKIEKSGDLLLVGKILVIIPSQQYYWSREASRIYGYDISDPKNPKEIWNIELKNSTSIEGARLRNGKIYLATKTNFSGDNSCAVKPFIVKGTEFEVRCTDIYHPTIMVPSEATFMAMTVDPISGNIEKSVSFIGSSNFTSSVVYMSQSGIYLSYYDPGDFVRILSTFFVENGDLVPGWLVEKLKNLSEYDISTSAKMTEIWELLSRYQNSLSNDDQLKLENEMANRMKDYLKKHRRDLDRTGIVKINPDSLEIEATGIISGKLLNQFSLDEYKGDLRVATTIGENFLGWGFGGIGSVETTNDLYILGDGLKMEGSVVDLGQGERIYAARFIEDKGYIVTFKQIDPFFVIDLSDPMNPEKKGELKIPGYSSYLHPITKDKILGIGAEDGKVKVSLFDVSSSSDPREIAKYNLNEYWSEALNNHHAFLLDPKHQIFFLPGGKGGYVFSYAGDKLELKKAVSDFAVKRAIFINDFLYIIGESSLTVIEEKNWEEVKNISL